MKKNSADNLIPMNKQPPEVRKQLARKGGLNSVKVRREKRAMADILRMMIGQPVDRANQELLNALKKRGISRSEATNGALINLQLIQLALGKNVNESTKLRVIELIHKFLDGQKVDVTTNGKDVNNQPFVLNYVSSTEDYRKMQEEIRKEKERKEMEEENE